MHSHRSQTHVGLIVAYELGLVIVRRSVATTGTHNAGPLDYMVCRPNCSGIIIDEWCSRFPNDSLLSRARITKLIVFGNGIKLLAHSVYHPARFHTSVQHDIMHSMLTTHVYVGRGKFVGTDAFRYKTPACL